MGLRPPKREHTLPFFIVKIPRIGEIMWYFWICVWLTALCIISLSSIHVVTKGRISLLLVAESCCVVWMDHIDGHLGCF